MKRSAYIILVFLFSCTSIQQAVIQDKQVIICVENYPFYDSFPQFYSCEVKRNGGEREFHVTQGSDITVYQLPSNKLTLLYEMEMGLKDVKANRFSKYKVIIQADRAKRSYRVNTDLIANFITGLKKK